MTSDLDKRLAALREKRLQADRVLEHDANKLAETIIDIDHSVRETSFLLGALDARTNLLAKNISKNEKNPAPDAAASYHRIDSGSHYCRNNPIDGVLAGWLD